MDITSRAIFHGRKGITEGAAGGVFKSNERLNEPRLLQ